MFNFSVCNSRATIYSCFVYDMTPGVLLACYHLSLHNSGPIAGSCRDLRACQPVHLYPVRDSEFTVLFWLLCAWANITELHMLPLSCVYFS